MAELLDRVVEENDAAVRTCLHDASLHHGENELGDLVEIGAGGEAMGGVAKALADGGGPAVEVGGDLVMNCPARRVDFESKASDGASEGKAGHEDLLAIAVEQQEDAFDGILGGCVDRAQDDGFQVCEVPVEDS